MSEKAIARRLRQVDELHALAVALLRQGLKHYEELVAAGKANKEELKRFKKHFA